MSTKANTLHTNPAAATSYYAFADQVDAVRHLVKADGTVANSYTYTAYGVTKSATEAVANPYRYGAGYTDTTTGLVKLGYRYYDPNYGRFTQLDPSRLETHIYAYSRNNPTSYSDPSGLLTTGELVGGAVGAVAGGALAATGVGAIASGIVGGAVGGAVQGAIDEGSVAGAAQGAAEGVALGVVGGVAGKLGGAAVNLLKPGTGRHRA